MEAAVVDMEAAVVDTVAVVIQDMVVEVEAVCHQTGNPLDSKTTCLQIQDHQQLTSHDQECSQAVCLQVVCHQVFVQAVHNQAVAVHHKVCDQEAHLQEACAHQVEFHPVEALLQAVTRVISLETLSASEIVYSFL